MRNLRWGPTINVVLLVGAVIGILQPAYSSDIGLTQITLSLFHPSWTQEFLMRWLLVIAFFALSYSAFIQFIFRNLPITIISTELSVRFGPNGQALMKRKQLLRANQPNVTAYFNSHGATAPKGSISRDKIRGSVYCQDWNTNDSLELRGTEKKLEVLHIFSNPLPYAWYMPLVPTWILNRDPQRLFKYLRKYVVIRESEVQYENEFADDPVMNFTSAGRYQHFNLSIMLEFERSLPKNFKVREIRNNGVTDLTPQKTSEKSIALRMDKVSASTIRIAWDT